MRLEELTELVAIGRESRRIEFKSPGSWADVSLRGQVIRATIAMANTRDGGTIIVGMKPDPERPGHHVPESLTPEQVSSFDPDQVIPQINRHATPNVELILANERLRTGENLVVIEVKQFNDYPVLCTRDVLGADSRVLTSVGRILVRSRRTIETTELQQSEDVRELMDAVVDRGLATYFRRRRIEAENVGPDDEARFRAQLRDLA